MAKFHEVIEALEEGRKFRHDDWYDGQWISWDDHSKHLMFSPKVLLSTEWVIQQVESETEPDDASDKKKSKKK